MRQNLWDNFDQKLNNGAYLACGPPSSLGFSSFFQSYGARKTLLGSSSATSSRPRDIEPESLSAHFSSLSRWFTPSVGEAVSISSRLMSFWENLRNCLALRFTEGGGADVYRAGVVGGMGDLRSVSAAENPVVEANVGTLPRDEPYDREPL